jgi:hypothetical protein
MFYDIRILALFPLHDLRALASVALGAQNMHHSVLLIWITIFSAAGLPYVILLMNLTLDISLQLLDRVFNILRENNPDLAGDRRRTVMRPPQVLREGTKKTVFVNFMDLCKT